MIDTFYLLECQITIHSPFLFDPIRFITPLSTISCKERLTVDSEHPRRSAISFLVRLDFSFIKSKILTPFLINLLGHLLGHHDPIKIFH